MACRKSRKAENRLHDVHIVDKRSACRLALIASERTQRLQDSEANADNTKMHEVAFQLSRTQIGESCMSSVEDSIG